MKKLHKKLVSAVQQGDVLFSHVERWHGSYDLVVERIERTPEKVIIFSKGHSHKFNDTDTVFVYGEEVEYSIPPPSPALKINPGIKGLVVWLQSLGFKTCDSGDGNTHDFSCDRDYPYVSILSNPNHILAEALRLTALLKDVGLELCSVTQAFENTLTPSKPCIQATIDPIDGTAIIDLMGLKNWPS